MIRFSKDERLCSRIAIQELFDTGSGFNKYPIRIVFLKKTAETAETHIQVLVSVSKKKFKRANKRNLLKRRMREAYRLNKSVIYEALGKQSVLLNMGIIYLSSDILPYKDIEQAMIAAFNKLIKQLI